MESGKLNLDDYDYLLPEERIAKYPLKKRDQSKLLVYRDHKIHHHIFSEFPDLIPIGSLLVFNETKVIPARLEFTKPSGAKIEIFLLDPVIPSRDVAITMKSSGKVVWHALVKNLKKWNDNLVLEKTIQADTLLTVRLQAEIHDRGKNLIELSWDPEELTLSEILDITGKVPLPPYLKRDPVTEDKARYQTLYSKNEGAVAAPTAGLHFTRKILKRLKEMDFKSEFLTLHVSAGTFQPIRQTKITQHPMHAEKISFTRTHIKNLLDHKNKIIAIGTTSMRILETLYWYGVKLLKGDGTELYIDSLFPYRYKQQDLPSRSQALQAILDQMRNNKLEKMNGTTRIFILPGYHFKIASGLVTNFHLPKSTLILLVAAFIGPDWYKVYQEAIHQDYRFLSYGDSSLLLT